jgi:hypothetical protein
MMPATLPNFVIIGAQKSGTTSLAYYLKAHPQVYMAPRKEVRYFDLNYDKGTQWYMEQFAGSKKKHRAVGEATPSYMSFEEVPARMAQVIPQARLIAILRDPVDRAYSHYWHNRSRGLQPLEFADALAAEPEHIASEDPTDRRYRFHVYEKRGHYLEQLQRVCQYYPRESLHVLLFEDLRDAPLETFQKVCRFLQVDDTVAPPNLGMVFNSFTPLKGRARKLRSLVWRVPPTLQRTINRVNPETGSYPPMDPSLRAELQRQYAEDNAALAAWLGRDLSCWSPQPAPTR